MHRDPPKTFLTMGVDIEKDWSDDFHKLTTLLGLTPKETINWVVDTWFRNAKANGTLPAHPSGGGVARAMTNEEGDSNE